MNRLGTMITAGTALDADVITLSPETLESWSAEEFALAIELARAPAAVRSGLGEALLHLMAADGAVEDGIALLPLDVDGNALTLGLGHEALDTLVGLLSNETVEGAGATLSLDAVEALCVAVLSPLTGIDVGRARWDKQDGTVAALKLGPAPLSLTGDPNAIRALQHAMRASSEKFPSSLAPFLGQRVPQRMAITTELVFALVDVSQAERAAMETGCGILLDTLWPSGRQVAGQRFVTSGLQWQAHRELRDAPLRVRCEPQVRMLDELPRDGTPLPLSSHLELVDGDRVIAHGRLVSVEISGTPHMVFEVDQLV